MTIIGAAGPRRVLNVGGGNKNIPIPAHYAGWSHLLLDINPALSPDVVCDARRRDTLPANQFDVIYCSHNLEHYYRHDTQSVLRGFLHVLKPDGFAEIRVPDLRAVMERVVRNNLELDTVLYQSGAGPISVLDVIYGLGSEIEASGSDFQQHKAGFTPQRLGARSKRPASLRSSCSHRPRLTSAARWRFVVRPRSSISSCPSYRRSAAEASIQAIPGLPATPSSAGSSSVRGLITFCDSR